MPTSATAEAARLAFATEITRGEPALTGAFARVPREAFLPPGPWKYRAWNRHDERIETRTTPDASPVHVYQDVAISCAVGSDGQPGGHVKDLAALAPRAGERVLHLDCRAGYVSALLAELVGPSGHVTAVPLDSLAESAARANLAHYPNIAFASDAAPLAPESYDVIHAMVGATHALSRWLDALRPSGRLLVALTPAENPHAPQPGWVFCITRDASTLWPANPFRRTLCPPYYPARDPALEARVLEVCREPMLGSLAYFVTGTPHAVTPHCLIHGDVSCLYTQPR
jgi:protein-L-isoaspartate O-methyltransferase